jgi:hypothetical protein
MKVPEKGHAVMGIVQPIAAKIKHKKTADELYPDRQFWKRNEMEHELIAHPAHEGGDQNKNGGARKEIDPEIRVKERLFFTGF